MKEQICKVCEQKLLLTEITTDTKDKVYAYLCDCSDMIKRKIRNYTENEDFSFLHKYVDRRKEIK